MGSKRLKIVNQTILENDIIIIGAGPAGLACSIYLARSGYLPIVLTGDAPGGQLIKTDIIENYPGFREISGCDLMMKMMSQAEGLGSEFIYEIVDSISKIAGNFNLKLTSGATLISKAILIATGATHKKIGCPGEDDFTNKGVSWCATCDGPLLKENKTVAVVGGGNTAVMEALFLSKFAAKVFLIHRRSSLRADKIMQDKLFSNDKIEVIWNSEVSEICGNQILEAIHLKSTIDNSERTLKIDGLFVAIGTVPASSFIQNLVEMDDNGYIKATDTLTSCDGVFAAGDVVSGSLKQAIFAAGSGALAARRIEEYLWMR
ncbi:MAG: thioredoxin-disulfide reductase [Holosporales bacterium]|jgi:thioredoxin reductase (NADPH)|nr:thioredoxin-disulfide reductase [Holosporales bacterium]